MIHDHADRLKASQLTQNTSFSLTTYLGVVMQKERQSDEKKNTVSASVAIVG
jgi:hypothetical protein